MELQEYQEISLIKQSEKSTVYLVRKQGEEQVFIRKILKGQHPVYQTLQGCQHPYLPKLYDVAISDDQTQLIEEYVEGQLLADAELSEKQLLGAVKELCSVLEFIHEKGIIHRDIKPSNIILAKDGHIHLIDFDAARMLKEEVEQDTSLLGTRGYAPPEQYGFAQTDARTDIYALGVTLKLLMGGMASKPHYKRIIQKCTNLNPDNRYQSAGQVKRAISYGKYNVWYGFAAILLLVILCLYGKQWFQPSPNEDMLSENGNLIVLQAPGNPHWDGETGYAVWDNVPESGYGDGNRSYHWRLYRRDTATPPDADKDMWVYEDEARGNAMVWDELCKYSVANALQENGVYYFAVSADGDGVNYAGSPYVMSDAFVYTGDSAQMLPAPTGLEWRLVEVDKVGGGRRYYATWSNLDDYEDADYFNVCVYDKDGNYVMNNRWSKKMIVERGYGGIVIRPEFLSEKGSTYRFTVEVYSSRPNEYKSYLIPDPVPEECYSPWYYH